MWKQIINWVWSFLKWCWLECSLFVNDQQNIAQRSSISRCNLTHFVPSFAHSLPFFTQPVLWLGIVLCLLGGLWASAEVFSTHDRAWPAGLTQSSWTLVGAGVIWISVFTIIIIIIIIMSWSFPGRHNTVTDSRAPYITNRTVHAAI